MRLPILLATLMPLVALTACSTTGPVESGGAKFGHGSGGIMLLRAE